MPLDMEKKHYSIKRKTSHANHNTPFTFEQKCICLESKDQNSKVGSKIGNSM